MNIEQLDIQITFDNDKGIDRDRLTAIINEVLDNLADRVGLEPCVPLAETGYVGLDWAYDETYCSPAHMAKKWYPVA